MRKIAKWVGGAVLTAGLGFGAVAVAQHNHAQPDNAQPTQLVTITGELIDTGCYASSGGEAKGKTHKLCAGKCMADGVPAAILPDGKDSSEILFLLTNPRVLWSYASQTIKVEGVVHDKLHAIDPIKLYVKNGDDWKQIELRDEHHKMVAPKPEPPAQRSMPGHNMSGHSMHGH